MTAKSKTTNITAFDYSQVEPRVKQAIFDAIGPNVAIGTEEIDHGRIFVKVISPSFNGLSEKKKQDAIWSALRALGENSQAVSLVLAFGTDEL